MAATAGSRTATVVVSVNSAPTMTVTPSDQPMVSKATTFTVVVTVGTSRITNAAIDFGDGTSANTSGVSTSHAYNDSGLKTVQVNAVAADGRQGTG